MMISDYRLELTFKNIAQLESKLNFCLSNNFNNINIPCKGSLKKDFFQEAFDYINKKYKKLDVFYHYSLYHQYSKNRRISYQKFLDFIDNLNCNQNNNNNILLVSGSNKKKDFDVISVLSDLKNEKILHNNFGIAYNPYLEKYYDNHKERDRYKEKHSSGLVNSIWLQFGTDINVLEKEINFIKKVTTERKIKIFGSLLIPSKQFITRFKFRPWKGVYISPEYLNSLEKFCFFTKDLISFYKENNVCPVIETEFSSIDKVKELYNILEN